MTATIPHTVYPSSGAPQGSGTGVTVNTNPDIEWQSGATITWTTGAVMEWIGAVETVADLSQAQAGAVPKTIYTGVGET